MELQIGTGSFIVYIKTEDSCLDIAKDVETSLMLGIMNSKDHYLEEKNKKVIGLMKDELGGEKNDNI